LKIIERRFKKFLWKILDYNLKDNCKSWQLIGKEYIKNTPNGEKPFNCQEYLDK